MDRLTLATETLAPKDGLPQVEWYDPRRIMKEAAFDWDTVVKATHPINCWYNVDCSFNVYAKDGIVLREEQPHNYPVPNDPDCPDFNPKGCNKGCAAAHRLYDPFRIRYPLKRVGARGEGKWKRVTWDEALDDITTTMLDVMVNDGPRAIQHGAATRTLFQPIRFWGWNAGFGFPEPNAEIGDDHQGAWEFTGKIFFCDSADDIFYTDMVFIWGGNPAYTFNTLYHYITVARYRGAKVVTVSVDYNASSLPADLWITVKPGSDAALALSMCQVVLDEGLYNERFIVEQTDLPLLVRMDNQKYLREKDIKADGRDYVYCLWDKASDCLTGAPVQSLALEGKKPALEGEWEVETLEGKVKVRPVFALLKERLNAEYRPEQASRMCGVGPNLIRQLAEEFAGAGGAVNISQANFSKYYHGNLMERACMYLWALCGHMGRRGANWVAFAGAWTPDIKVGALQPLYQRDLPLLLANHPKAAEWQARGFSQERIAREGFWETTVTGGATFTSLYHYFHSGLIELSKKYNSWDPHLKRPLEEYVKEGLEKRLKPVLPSPERDPKVLLAWSGDVVRRIRGNQYVIQNLLPKLKLMLTVDWRWNASAAYSDYILPAACPWYETESALSGAVSVIYTPWITYSGKAVDPPGEAKDDWWIWTKLFTGIAEKARAKGITSVTDPEFGVERRVDNWDQAITTGGVYGPDDLGKMTRDSLSSALNLEASWEELVEKGHSYLTDIGKSGTNAESAGDFTQGEPFVPNTWHVQKKQPWPTATGRMQYYIDHDW
ncbi:MAG: molybdopterin-dependent oxidoreductase, partial [Chloroflexi bacterium]|nr:molybdopterin-dependent oxidoreductase [Chloroflexota bacterium]